jgi:hypothetical protein
MPRRTEKNGNNISTEHFTVLCAILEGNQAIKVRLELTLQS